MRATKCAQATLHDRWVSDWDGGSNLGDFLKKYFFFFSRYINLFCLFGVSVDMYTDITYEQR